MAENRLVRELESRESAQRNKVWTPPQTLPAPNPQAGWVFRYIRTSTMGQADPQNTSAKFREGWEPVKAEDHPELMHHTDPNSKFKGNIEIGGLLLCKAPEELMKQRDDYYAQQAKAQLQSLLRKCALDGRPPGGANRCKCMYVHTLRVPRSSVRR